MESNSIIHADIFFFVSTVSLAVISLGIVIALIYLIKILINIKDVSDKIKNITSFFSFPKSKRKSVKK